MEACDTSHHWARELIRLGHDVRLMPPVYVRTYVKHGNTDASDAQAICEAVTQPAMRFVTVKSAEQQAALSLHRIHDLLVRPGTGTTRRMSETSEPAEQIGILFADPIKASSRKQAASTGRTEDCTRPARQNIKSALAMWDPSTDDVPTCECPSSIMFR
jgi:hypothetical protein